MPDGTAWDLGVDADYDLNTVIFFQMRFGKNVYSYAALKTQQGWYLTGKDTQPFSWPRLCTEYLAKASTVSYAPEWKTIG